MGWWSISDRDGGLSWGQKDSGMYNGDGPADILGPAVEKVIKEYEQAWGRKPYMAELRAAVAFVAGSHDLPESPEENNLTTNNVGKV
jgi:hypothetical protein